MISKIKLISHRFLTFSDNENTAQGLLSALDNKVSYVEFDIRITKCGTAVIYHDPEAIDNDGVSHKINTVKYSDFNTLKGRFKTIPSLDEVLDITSNHSNKSAKLLIDIKDFGYEKDIHSSVVKKKLSDRSIYVSWLPEVIYALHKLTPLSKFCFSYWCKPPSASTEESHIVFKSQNGEIKNQPSINNIGKSSGWYIEGALSGTLRDIISMVCVPRHMLDTSLVNEYHQNGIEVSSFSYLNIKDIIDDKKYYNIDYFFVDSKKVFDGRK